MRSRVLEMLNKLTPTNSQRKTIDWYLNNSDKLDGCVGMVQNSDCTIVMDCGLHTYKIGRLGAMK